MTAAVIPMPRRHGDVLAAVPQRSGPDFEVGDAPDGAWCGQRGLRTSHIPAPDVPDVVRGLLLAVEHDPDADREAITHLLEVLARFGYHGPDTAA